MSRAKRYKFIFTLLGHIPYSISSIPYTLAIKIVKTIFQSENVKIWPRNSYIFKDLVFALSDLDLTFLIKNKPRKTALVVLSRYANLKKILRFLGEINFYYESDLALFKKVSNFYEISRDPILFNKIFPDGKTLRPYERLIFKIRLLYSDSENLTTAFSLRKKKISRSLTLMGYSQQEIFNVKNLSLLLATLDERIENLKFVEFFSTFMHFEETDNNSMNQFYVENEELKREFIVFIPHRWIGASLHFQKFEEDLEILKNLNEQEQEIFVEGIRWEIWGLFTQYLIAPEQTNLHIHLGNIERALQVVKPPLLQNVDIMIKKLLERQQKVLLE